MKEFPGLKILAILLISLFTGACATDRPPTGGPPDKTPLSVITSAPESGTVNVTPRTIHLEFNHYVSKGSLVNSIFFSPIIPDYDVTVHGKEADIRIYSPLKPGSTYTLTLQKSLKGVYGNQAERSWTLAFSTGPVIDSGKISGRVWTNRMAPASNITVMAYGPVSTGARLPDDLTSLPDYIAQTDQTGEFRFESLGSGRYRFLAVNDKNGDMRFNQGKEEFGVTSTPSVECGTSDLSFRLASSDAAATSLRSCRTINNREIELGFSNKLSAGTFDLNSVTISDISKGTIIPILAYFTPGRSAEDTTFRLLTGPMSGNAFYRIAFAPQGNRENSSELTFPGSTHDEKYPGLTLKIVPADKTVNLLPETVRPEAGSSVELQFNLPVEESSLRQAVSLISIRDKKEQEIPFSISRIDTRTFSVHASGGFEPGQEYRIKVLPALVTGLAGEKSRQVMVESLFSVAGPEQYGEISGTGKAEGPAVIIEARRPGFTTIYRTIANTTSGGAFSFSLHTLPPGEYTVSGFIPVNRPAIGSVTQWKSGSAQPYVPSDPFSAVWLNVRPGWTTENIRLDIPSPHPSGN
ncbi:MAG: Ig-like domain-containing protein [Chlorobiaceae bacterium]|nr:Ig-like domain-containing protein [Chlorobiaceae bacterium]